MRPYIVPVTLVAIVSLLLIGCSEPATPKSKRSDKYIDPTKTYGIFIGTPTPEAGGIPESMMELKPGGVFILKHDGLTLGGNYTYLGGEMELTVREVDGIPETAMLRLKSGGEEALATNKANGRKPDNKQEFDRLDHAMHGIFWRFVPTKALDEYKMNTSDRGPGLYNFKKAPAGTKMPVAGAKEAGQTQLGGVAGVQG